MAINDQQYTSGDQLTVTTEQNVSDDSNNVEDNIHSQYFTPIVNNDNYTVIQSKIIGSTTSLWYWDPPASAYGSYDPDSKYLTVSGIDDVKRVAACIDFVRGIEATIDLTIAIKANVSGGAFAAADLQVEYEIFEVSSTGVVTSKVGAATQNLTQGAVWTSYTLYSGQDITSVAQGSLCNVRTSLRVNSDTNGDEVAVIAKQLVLTRHATNNNTEPW